MVFIRRWLVLRVSLLDCQHADEDKCGQYDRSKRTKSLKLLFAKEAEMLGQVEITGDVAKHIADTYDAACPSISSFLLMCRSTVDNESPN